MQQLLHYYLLGLVHWKAANTESHQLSLLPCLSLEKYKKIKQFS